MVCIFFSDFPIRRINICFYIMPMLILGGRWSRRLWFSQAKVPPLIKDNGLKNIVRINYIYVKFNGAFGFGDSFCFDVLFEHDGPGHGAQDVPPDLTVNHSTLPNIFQ